MGPLKLICVDITVNEMSSNDNMGLRTTQYIQQSLDYFPLLGDLVILFKSFLARLELNNAYKGGLGSYAICLIIIAYLQFRKKSKREENIADMLTGLLQFYGSEFNPATHGISTSNRQEEDTWNPYFDIPNYLKTSPLVVLDPTQHFIKNITVSAFQISLIQNNFAKAAHLLSTAKELFFAELRREMKEQGGVKKDYFLSYGKKKDRALNVSKNIVEEVLLATVTLGP